MRTLGFAAAFLAGSVVPVFAFGFDDLNLGIASRNRGDWDSAIASFDTALAAGDLTPDQKFVAYLDRGQAHVAKKQHDEAAADYLAAIDLRPKDLLVATAVYAEYSSPEKANELRHVMDAVISHAPDNGLAYAVRARAYENLGDHQKQLDDLQTSLAKNPEQVELNLDLGVAEFEMGKPDLAADFFSRFPDRQSPAFWLLDAAIDLKLGKSLSSDPALRELWDWVSYGTPRIVGWAKLWPNLLMSFLEGNGSEDYVYSHLTEGDQDTLPERICQADFYIGEWRITHGDKPGGQTLLKKAAQECPSNIVESRIAVAELSNAR